MSEETEYDFKRTSAQIETLLDKIPAEGDVAKVYNTTLDIFGIQDGSVVTKEQNVEVSNIMDKWNQGYIVTYVDTRQSTFHYGVLNVCRCDDGVPTTLSVINDRGDLLAYSFEHVGEETWTVTNKTSGGGGKVYQTTLHPLDMWPVSNGEPVSKKHIAEIKVIYQKAIDGYIIIPENKNRLNQEGGGESYFGTFQFECSSVDEVGSLPMAFTFYYILYNNTIIQTAVQSIDNLENWTWYQKVVNLENMAGRFGTIETHIKTPDLSQKSITFTCGRMEQFEGYIFEGALKFVVNNVPYDLNYSFSFIPSSYLKITLCAYASTVYTVMPVEVLIDYSNKTVTFKAMSSGTATSISIISGKITKMYKI